MLYYYLYICAFCGNDVPIHFLYRDRLPVRAGSFARIRIQKNGWIERRSVLKIKIKGESNE